jgi:hypothetical protein
MSPKISVTLIRLRMSGDFGHTLYEYTGSKFTLQGRLACAPLSSRSCRGVVTISVLAFRSGHAEILQIYTVKNVPVFSQESCDVKD